MSPNVAECRDRERQAAPDEHGGPEKGGRPGPPPSPQTRISSWCCVVTSFQGEFFSGNGCQELNPPARGGLESPSLQVSREGGDAALGALGWGQGGIGHGSGSMVLEGFSSLCFWDSVL